MDISPNDVAIHGYGQKKAKDERQKNTLLARKVEAAEQIAKNGQARTRTLREQLQVQRDNFELAIFTTKVDESESDLAFYLEKKKRIILKRLETEEKEISHDESVN
ncbi:unnamed protein product [Aphanomyces euteiches]|nr:hypothetical protein AeRB84_014089 [Aphanomyces euteiches]